jgi:alkylation response protein AidB-like acyl-CoA dehydrogenase
MNFDFSDDQQAIKRTAHDLLVDRFTPARVRELAEAEQAGTAEEWGELAELGWPGIFVSEEDGGQGLGVLELVILQEELGYALAPVPFFSSACAALVLQAAGSPEQRAAHLAPLARGERRATLALWDSAGSHDPRDQSLTDTDGKLTGTKVLVPDAVGAAAFVVAGRDGVHYLVSADADGVTVSPTRSVDATRPAATVTFENAEAEPLNSGEPGAVDRAYDAMVVALAAESVGIAQRTMEMAVEYAREREQFGRPIGAYQAVSHRCAQMLLEVENARSATYYAGWALDHEPAESALASAMAGAYASDTGRRVTQSSLQVHGGIAFTWEHDLHFFLKRAQANAHALGDARHHRSRVADLAGI